MQTRAAVLGDLFRRIGIDYASSLERKDDVKQKELLGLVIAMERAYPEEMAVLRDEGLELSG